MNDAETILTSLLVDGWYALNLEPSDDGSYWFAVDSSIHLSPGQANLVRRLLERASG